MSDPAGGVQLKHKRLVFHHRGITTKKHYLEEAVSLRDTNNPFRSPSASLRRCEIGFNTEKRSFRGESGYMDVLFREPKRQARGQL